MTAKQKKPKPSASKPPRIASKEHLGALGIHTIRLHSGEYVKIRIPDLAMLVALGVVPERLRAVALARVLDEMTGGSEAALTEETVASANGQAKTPEQMERDIEKVTDTVNLHIWLVSQMLVEPEYTYEELLPGSPVKLPDEDMVMLIQIATRERNRDAAGVRLGVARIDSWADSFRAKHECGPGCAACAAVLEEHSTVGVDFLRLLQLHGETAGG